jgi:hypothetical protein
MPCRNQKHHVKQSLTHLDRVAQFTVRQQPCRAPHIAMLCRAATQMPRSPGSDGSLTLHWRMPANAAVRAAVVNRGSTITACAARFSSKDGQQTIWFRGGLTVRISSSPPASPVSSVPPCYGRKGAAFAGSVAVDADAVRFFGSCSNILPLTGVIAHDLISPHKCYLMLLIAIAGMASPSSRSTCRPQIAKPNRADWLP